MSDYRWLIPLVLLLLAMFACETKAAIVYFVSGQILEPVGLNEGEDLNRGTTVRTGDDAMVMIEYRWPSGEAGFDCQHLAIFGYGASHTVSAVETPGRCATNASFVAAMAQEGQVNTSATRYGDPSYDIPTIPARVSNSWNQSRPLDQWIRNAERSYTGVVESVSNRNIVVLGPRSSSAKTFSLGQSVLAASADRNSLFGKNVRIAYRSTATGPEAIRIKLQNGVAVLQPFAVIQVEPNLPQVGQRLDNSDLPSQSQVADTQEWRCKVDLHQGDTGELQFRRKGNEIKGAMYIERGGQKHTITGTWTNDKIEFWRELSSASGQSFIGAAARSSDGAIAVAGRFAYKFSGVWSADCSPMTSNITESKTGPIFFDVVLNGYKGNKITAIKSVRTVLGLGLKEAKDAVENPPNILSSNVSLEEANRIAGVLMNAGVNVSIRQHQ